jgi:hypothetical protein
MPQVFPTAAAAAPAAAYVTTLTDIDFTSLGSAAWSDGPVTLDGNSWTVANSANASTFGPSGSTLVIAPTAGDLYSTSRTAPQVSIDLSSLDASISDDAEYVVQVICAWPSAMANFSRAQFGFYSAAGTSEGYTAVYGPQWSSGGIRTGFRGGTSVSTAAAGGSEVSWWVKLNRSASHECRYGTSTDADPFGGTLGPVLYCGTGAAPSAGPPVSILLKPSTARVVIAAVQPNPTGGYAIDRIIVSKIAAAA